MDIVDVHTVWQCADSGIKVSTDGALTWQDTEGNRQSGGCASSFIDAETGWVYSLSFDKLEQTTDGGATWEELSLPEDLQDVVAISLQTPTDGYLFDTAGILYVTQDGGTSWSLHPVDLDLEAFQMLSLQTVSAAVRFFDADHGIVAVKLLANGSSQVVVTRTKDGGQTWEQESAMPFDYDAVPYLSHDGMFLTVYAAGEITLFRYAGS
ncbi:MAG: hypothetical protein GY847_00180 [Proteobacteria bacterium]|nr:hypothetical protein [Pseudomonadota bacterium]